MPLQEWSGLSLLEEIYREIEVVPQSSNAHFFSGSYPVNVIARAVARAWQNLRKQLRGSDMEAFTLTETLTVDSNVRITLPDEYYHHLAAQVGQYPVYFGQIGDSYDDMLRRYPGAAPSGAVYAVRVGNSMQLYGPVSSGGSFELQYQRKMHPLVALGLYDFGTSTKPAVANSGTHAYREDVFVNGEMFNLTDSEHETVIASSTTNLTVDTPMSTGSGKNCVVLSLGEVPQDYVSALIAKTCLVLMKGEDLGMWREAVEEITSAVEPTVHSDPRRFVPSSIHDSFDYTDRGFAQDD